VKELEELPFVKRVEVVPVCEIYIDACIKVVVDQKSPQVKREVADKVISVASRFEERLGRRPEIYFDIVEE